MTVVAEVVIPKLGRFTLDKAQEPYHDFVSRLKDYLDPRYTDEHLGDGESEEDRVRAADILSEGGIVGMFIGGKVGGLLANPFCQSAVDAVIDLKSKGGTPRHSLFPLVARAQTARPFIQKDHIGGCDLTDLAGRGFFQYPATSDAVTTFEKRFFSDDEGIPIIQFFIPEDRSLLEKLLDLTEEHLSVPALLGTSANFTGAGSIKEPNTAALFGLATSVYWLYGHEENALAGSYPIQRFSRGELIQVR